MSTERPRLAVRLAIAAIVAIGLSSLARGQTYEVLHAFTVPATLPVAGLVQGTDGFFYGTTRGGGASAGGTVFKIDPNSNLTTIHTFAYNDGNDPEAGLVLGNDGKFYGTTQFGGANGLGAVFRIDPPATW